MNPVKIKISALAVLSAILLSIPFLIPHGGAVALFALVPLLWMERVADRGHITRFWVCHYGAFLLWNAITTFWVCNATIGGGIFACVANAFQMSVVFGLYRLSKRVFRGSVPYLFLAALWIAWERAYFGAQISWPWLTLGNALAGTVSLAQWYEYTGTLGGSLWIWACNLSLFGLLCAWQDGTWRGFGGKARVASLGGYLVLLIAPVVLSVWMYARYEEGQEGETLDVVIVQPNIDPYHKFQALDQSQQNAILLGLLDKGLASRRSLDSLRAAAEPLLALAPETFTNDVITNDLTAGRTWRHFQKFLQDYPGVNLLFGASSYEYLRSDVRPTVTAREVKNGTWVESHNSALMTDATGRGQIYHKSKLVVGVEMTPYPAFFTRVDDMLGGVMGRCVGQKEVSLLDCRAYGPDGQVVRSVPVGCAVCYESVYGEHCAEYVRKGARLLTVITNDAWWGDTPGYMQHLRYSALRAIETRRDIARCANTGISAFISSRGDILQRSPWWEQAVLQGKVRLHDRETFFVRNGDIVGRLASFVAVLLLLAMGVRLMMGKRV